MSRRFAAAAVLGLVTLASTAMAHDRAAGGAGTTKTFAYEQKKYLYSRNGPGGLAYVPEGVPAGATLPVVVLLHGMNPDALVHMWFGPPYGDLRPVVDALARGGKAAPFVLAAPTHTRFATGATVMWHGFDLAGFLTATERALAGTVTLDRSKVVVVAHSGGGCNPTGGIFAESVAAAKPLGVLAVDTCIDDKTIGAAKELAASTPLRVYWQRTWPRPVDVLTRECPRCTVEEVEGLGANGHLDILPRTLERALPELLPAPSSPARAGSSTTP